MKLLYCIAGTYNSGGMERVLANKANYLVRRGCEVVIVTTDQREASPFFVLDERIRCIDLAINYEENNGKSLLNKVVKYPYKQWLHKRRLEDVLRREKPDLTISMYCNEASLLPSIKDGSCKVLEIHFSKFKRLQYGRRGLWGLLDRIRTKVDERLVRRYDKFVVLTEEDKGYWGELSNIEVIPNARTFTPSTTSSLVNKQVLAIGRYTHQKGFDRLLEAWRLVASQHPDWTLLLVGSGEDEGQLRKQIEQLSLSDNVRLEPPTSCIEDLYLSSSIYVMSSRYEGLPMVLLEAQAYGLPIASFRCKCGPSDVVEDGKSGFLVEEGDVKALANAIIRLIDSYPLRCRMSEEALVSSMRFAEEMVMKKWIELFEKLRKR